VAAEVELLLEADTDGGIDLNHGAVAVVPTRGDPSLDVLVIAWPAQPERGINITMTTARHSRRSLMALSLLSLSANALVKCLLDGPKRGFHQKGGVTSNRQGTRRLSQRAEQRPVVHIYRFADGRLADIDQPDAFCTMDGPRRPR